MAVHSWRSSSSPLGQKRGKPLTTAPRPTILFFFFDRATLIVANDSLSVILKPWMIQSVGGLETRLPVGIQQTACSCSVEGSRRRVPVDADVGSCLTAQHEMNERRFVQFRARSTGLVFGADLLEEPGGKMFSCSGRGRSFVLVVFHIDKFMQMFSRICASNCLFRSVVRPQHDRSSPIMILLLAARIDPIR